MSTKMIEANVRYEYSTYRTPWTQATKEFYEEHKDDGLYQFRAVFVATVPLKDSRTRKVWEEAGGDYRQFSQALSANP